MLRSAFNDRMFSSMFDELKEVKYFKEITKSYNVKYFKETKCLKNLQKAETHLETKRASMMELFAYYFYNKTSIIDVRLRYI